MPTRTSDIYAHAVCNSIPILQNKAQVKVSKKMINNIQINMQKNMQKNMQIICVYLYIHNCKVHIIFRSIYLRK